MRRELKEAPAMAPTAVVATSFSFKSVSRFLRAHDHEAMVITAWGLWFFLRHLQSFLGPMRRRSAHWFVQYSAMAAYHLPTVLMFYTANAVYSSDSGIKILLSMGCFMLLIISRFTITMRAFSMGHGPFKLESWRLLPWLLYFAWLQWGLIWRDRKVTVPDFFYYIVYCLAPVLYVVLAKPGSRADILDYETKLFADHMIRESRRSSPFFHCDATNSSLYDGCKYPIMHKKGGQEDQQQRMITFSQVKQEGGLLKETGDADICLSYSFCRLLARRFFGFPCAEDGDAQVRDLVLTELMADDCSRAYNIVEAQLALLHDYFYTNYHSNISRGLSVKQGVLYFFGIWVIIAIWVSLEALIIGSDLLGLWDLGYLCGMGVLTGFVHTAILQAKFPVLPPYWHAIRNVILYYSRGRKEDTGPAAAVTAAAAAAPGSPCQGSRQSYSYWRNKLGQYSLLEDYDRHSCRKALVAWCKVHVLSQTSYKFIKHHPAEEEDVRVPDSVRRLVARTIRDIDAPPTVRNLEYFSRTFRRETLTHTILMWHVATCYCDMMSQTHPVEEDDDVPHQALQEPSTGYRQVATTLSKYCAYLVAFLPELLPEHSLTAKVVLQQVLQEGRDLLGTKRMSMEEKRRKLRAHPEVRQEDENTFERGVRLGKELEKLSNVPWRWKAMADFWSRTVLYIASSDKASVSHIERLAHGGEFVTHLWALLCNAGILKRAAEEWTPMQPEASGMAEQDAPQAEVEAIVLFDDID